ncbi:MAG: AAA family ATPase [archaeon]
MIFGVTGFFASGKGEFCSYLTKKGFIVYSLSDVIRDEMRRRGQEMTRESLQAAGNELRQKHGPDVLARMIMKKLELGKSYVIDSIRNPDEVKVLKRNSSFKLIYIDAPIELRFKRAKKRNREKEALTFDDFRISEEKELHNPLSSGQQLIKCKEMSDLTIVNDSSMASFRRKIDILVEGLG